MPDRYKVLRVIARLNIGGPALHACLLTSRLNPAKYDSRLVVGSPAPHEGDFLELRGIALDGLTRIRELGRRELTAPQDLVALGKLVRLIRRERPHIVHTHTAKAGALGRLAAALTRVPVVIHTFHGHVLDGYFPPAKSRAFTAIERALARWTTELVAVSPVVRHELLQKGIGRPANFSVIRLGLDLQPFTVAGQFRGQLRSELQLDPGTPLVGIVGRLVAIKAHDLFLQAAAGIVRTSGAHFVVVGDGQLRASLEAQAHGLGLSDRVHFLGWRADLPRIYADLDVVVLTSKNEGSPVALIEAMAAQRPVVATRVGGVPDVVADGVHGLLVPPGDAAAVADAVLELLGDSDQRLDMGAAGQAAVVSTYSVARLLGDIDTLYSRALARAGL